MKAQTPAEGIMAFKVYPGMKTFRVPCECSCDNELDFYIEVEDGIITAGFDVKVKSHYWNELFRITYKEPWIIVTIKSWINSVHHRLAVTWEVLTKGYVTSSTHILMSKQQTLNFSQTLLDAVNEFDKQNKEIKKNIAKCKAQNAKAKEV